ncbi:hypothetical protein ACIP98_35565 [Streptomyces sp. NPDC088354]|uniref:hypothetical protein n=1 Tax=Streptomyces sp. NPDC088354 TaxID=3365856 RepID=UPI00380CDD97
MHTTSGTDTAADDPQGRVVRRHAAARPVFVDASGRRQLWVRRTGWFLAVPAVGYVALLLSAALGGPTVSSPYLPLPEAGDRPPAVSGPGTGGSAWGKPTPTTTAQPMPSSGTGRPAGTRSRGGSAVTPATGATGTAGAAGAAGTPSPAPSPSGSATGSSPAPTVTHGKSKATTHPVPVHTGHGRG